MNSKIINRRYAKQLIDFANITIGNKGMPTDCDGLIEYHGKAYVLFELKLIHEELRFMETNVMRGKKRIIDTVIDDPDIDIDAAACHVRKFYYAGKWYRGSGTLKALIDRFIAFVDGRH